MYAVLFLTKHHIAANHHYNSPGHGFGLVSKFSVHITKTNGLKYRPADNMTDMSNKLFLSSSKKHFSFLLQWYDST